MKECLEQKSDIDNQKYIKSDSPKVSIIIPIFNCQNIIKSSLASIQRQSLKELEIILINDYSIDNSKEIIDKIQKEDPRIIIINNNKNMGTLYSRNIGALIANGSYIFALDNDDMFLNKNLILKMYNIAVKYNYDIIGFKSINGFNYNLNADEMFEDTFIKNKKDSIIYQPELKFLSIKNNDCHIWGKCIKNQIYKSAISLFYSIRNITYLCFAEDDIMTLMLFSSSKSFRFLPIYGLFHLISNNTASLTLSRDHIVFSKIYFLDFLFDFSKNNIQEKKNVIIIAIKLYNDINIKKLLFNKKNKEYLDKVLIKIYHCIYISHQDKSILKKYFSF